MRVPRPVLLTAAIASASALLLAGCGSPTTGSAQPVDAAAAPVAAVAPAKDCADGLKPTASLEPGNISTNPNTMTDSPTWDNVKANKHLTVGTSGDVRLWGARNPETGSLEGYDIDVLKEVADALGVTITYKVINYAERLTALDKTSVDGGVDLVAHTMTINCDRWAGTGSAPNAINFSTEYYEAGQKVLIRSDQISKIKTIEDLKGQKVCVPAASTNVDNVKSMGLDLVQLDVIGDCLVQFQEGEVAAITGDDTVLAGFADQDPYAKVVGDAFSSEPYGLGINADDPQFTRFVNAVLEKLRAEGRLKQIYDETMKTALPETNAPKDPAVIYGRDISKLGRK